MASEGLVRIGVALAPDGAELLRKYSKEFGVSQSKMVEIMLRLPHEVIRDVVSKAVAQIASEKKERLARSKATRELMKNLSPEQLSAIEAILKGDSNA